jgi:hypothetical protein
LLGWWWLGRGLISLEDGGSRRALRFYATVCTAAIGRTARCTRWSSAPFDSDYGVRSSASEALTGYPLRDLDLAMITAAMPCTARISSGERGGGGDRRAGGRRGDRRLIGRARRAAGRVRAAGADRAARGSGDVGAQGGSGGTSTAEAPIEWLIEALGQKDAGLRRGAEDLRRVTGESFGRGQSGRRERDDARGGGNSGGTRPGANASCARRRAGPADRGVAGDHEAG